MGRAHGFDVYLHRGPAKFREGGKLAEIELAAAAPQQQPEKREKTQSVADAKQLEDVPSIEAVDPFAEKSRVFAHRQQGFWKTAVEQATVQIGCAESPAFLPGHRAKVDNRLAPGQGVVELAGGGQGG